MAIQGGYMVIDAHEFGNPRWICGQRCTGVKEVLISKMDVLLVLSISKNYW